MSWTRLRILSIFFHPSSSFTALGGAEKRFIRVLEVWNEKGVSTTVVEPSPKLTSDTWANCETIEIRNIVGFSGKSLLSIYLEWILWVAKACFLCPRLAKQNQYDVILSSNNTLPNLVVAHFLRLVSRRPLIVTVHHLDFPYLDRKANIASSYGVYRRVGFGVSVAFIKALTLFIMLMLLRRSDACITVSNFTADFLQRNRVDRNKIDVSGNGIDIDLISKVTAKRKRFAAVFVGRITRDKGVFDLVKIWMQLAHDGSGRKLVIIGSGPDFMKLKEMIIESDMSSAVLLRGRCSDSELYTLMKASEVFLFPSMFEGWGLAVGEALACGLPVVCYEIPALREVFGECKSVFFIPPRNIVKFAEIVMEILDCGSFAKLAAISREYVERFSWRQVATKDLQVISDLAQQFKPAGRTGCVS